ncbi:VOC family protein [Tumebacillus permanentifrigoris]|uniref:VOC domain-containing protein n=1 Tax=Tumebacillus permanentifrigoris TaxID=378543 RepID=A0A316D8K7_9BACL|nr:VOC family protein [Tumebacillus permanentifrigoris]PWK13183.1 hypothetical protein C7459_108204 [Tumebacillus permanentifrigoris]
MNNRVLHFEIHVEDPVKAGEFYKDVFGWKIESWGGGDEPYYLVSTGDENTPGINGGLMKSMDGQTRTVNSILVPDVDEYVAKVVAAGGTVALPKMPIPGVGYLAYLIDPQGVLFGITHMDPEAK